MRFEAYVGEHGDALLRFAFALTGNHHAAEDLIQSTLIKVYRRWYRVRRADNVHAYVRRIATNSYIDETRKRSFAERPVVLDDKCSVVGREHADPAESIVNKDTVQGALDSLAPRARAVVVLRYLVDMDDAEIAGILGISTSTVRSTASRALQSMHRVVSPIHPGGHDD